MKIQIIVWLIFLTLFSGCSTYSTQKLDSQYSGEAYEQYIKASHLMKMAKSESSYTKALICFEKAHKKIQSIQSKYPSTKIVKDLKSNKTNISGLQLNQLPKLHRQLKRFALYDQDPFWFSDMDYIKALDFYAHFYAIELTDILSKEEISHALEKALQRTENNVNSAYVAKLYADIGQKEKAKQFIAQAFPDTFVASAYAKIGQKQRAIQTLNKIKEALKNCKSCDPRGAGSMFHSPPYYLSAAYVEVDQLSQALDVLESAARGTETRSLTKIITQAYARHGNINKANQILTSALQKVKNQHHDFEKNLDYIDIAIAYANIGEIQKARQVFHQIPPKVRLTPLPIASMFSTYDAFTFLLLHSKVAVYYAKIGQKDRARRLLSELAYGNKLFRESQRFSDTFIVACLLSAYAESGLKPDKNTLNKRQLTKIFYKSWSMNEFWRNKGFY